MREISGAIVGITLVLAAVFIPMGLASGSVGAIYRQFTLSMAVSILFSAFLALTLTPALCATILKPVAVHASRGFFGWFNRRFDALTASYTGWVGWVLRRGGRMLVIYVALLLVLAAGYSRVPTSFVPEEDQGSFFAMFRAAGRRHGRAHARHRRRLRGAYRNPPPTSPESTVILGFGFSGSGPNAAQAFTSLKDWNERSVSVDDEIAAATDAMATIPEGTAHDHETRRPLNRSVPPPASRCASKIAPMPASLPSRRRKTS